MDTDEAVAITQTRLAREGESLRDLVHQFRDLVSPKLIGESSWNQILRSAEQFPIEVGAYPFGFEIPLHVDEAKAGFGISLGGGNSSDTFSQNLRRLKHTTATQPIFQLFKLMNSKHSSIQKIVGRKLRLEYETESNVLEQTRNSPGMLLRPIERPILGVNQQVQDVNSVVEALFSSVGWVLTEEERNSVARTYQAQPKYTRTESFGIFPSQARALRLAVMGFKDCVDLGTYLADCSWPGQVSTATKALVRWCREIPAIQGAININIEAAGLSPTLGLSFMANKRTIENTRYWLDGPAVWEPVLAALRTEKFIAYNKLAEIASWNTTPQILFAKTGQFVLLRGVHHIKLEMCENRLEKVKAYLYLILTGALMP